MDLVFRVGALVLLVAFVVVLFLPEEKLRDLSGMAARQQEAAETAAAATGVSAPSSQMVDGDTLEDGGVAPARPERGAPAGSPRP
jgi:hypothetical protein